MLVKVLASGSKGNCTFLETNDCKILLDMGTNLSNIKGKLEELGVSISDIDYILITHTHTDHIGALTQYIKKYHGIVYVSQDMLDELGYNSPLALYPNLCMYEDILYFGKTKVHVFKTSHDTKDSKSFVVEEDKNSVVYLTDTGYINKRHFNVLRDRTLYLFESNYDVEMLINGKYPSWLKTRIAGPSGHLSNKDSAIYLAKLVGSHTKKIILMHLSQDNNTPTKALQTLKDTFKEYEVSLCDIGYATQTDGTEEIIL